MGHSVTGQPTRPGMHTPSTPFTSLPHRASAFSLEVPVPSLFPSPCCPGRISRLYDLVLLGATGTCSLTQGTHATCLLTSSHAGYTGRLTAEHIAIHLPADFKWALAGRSETKLQAVVDACAKANPNMSKPGLEIVNVQDEDQVDALVRTAALVITTVGPYVRYGEGVLRACARAGTHYLDCTGEVPWVARMIQKYEAAARDSGAIIISHCGIESAAPDLATWAMVRHLRSKLDVPTQDVVLSIKNLSWCRSGELSAALWRSSITSASRS